MRIECYRDSWGIPHLRADDAFALAFAQGRNAAADRAWQLETARRRATGAAAALLGAAWAGWDRLMRQARVAADAARAFDALDAETREWVGRYVDGVNSVGTGTPWEPWTPLAIWHAEHLTFGAGFPARLWRERVRETLGEAAVDAFAMDGPEPVGSNGWLVTGELTASGMPIVAGDPHRFLQSPGSYQQVRLACGEFDVAGFAIPGIPGIAHFGHLGSVAWGITNAMADSQDLYRERLRRGENGTVEAFGPQGWEPARVWRERFDVAGGEAQEVEVIETARGPVVADLGEEALSLRGPVQARPDLGFGALLPLLRARTVADVDAALDAWVLPVNVVMAADTAGGTLHRVAGRVPERDRRNYRGPVPAWEPQYAWSGWKPMPRKDIDRIAVMANDRGVAGPLGVEFCPPHRADRIRGLLETRSDWAADDMAAIHTDTRLPTAGVILDLLPALKLSDEGERLRERLLLWDRRMDADSEEAAAFASLRAAFVRGLGELPVFGRLNEPAGLPSCFAPWLALLPHIGYALEHVLASGLVGDDERDRALTAAAEEAARGERAAWGEVHRLAPWHDAPPGEAEQEPLPGMAGDADCVLATAGVPGVTEDFTRGPAARWVWDLADRERSRWIVPFGAAGEPGPHQWDQHPLWRRGELVPVVSDWQALQADWCVVDRPAVFEEEAAGFGRVAIVKVDPEADLDLLHGWVKEERAVFWGMTGHSRDQVLEVYEHLDSLATHHAFLVLREGEPVALIQTYEPAADPVGECYAVEPGDFGAHLLVAGARGPAEPGFTGALMGVFAAYLFADPAVRRIVAEPDARNTRAHVRLRRSGFTLGPEIELPHKRARLAFLRREDAPCLHD